MTFHHRGTAIRSRSMNATPAADGFPAAPDDASARAPAPVLPGDGPREEPSGSHAQRRRRRPPHDPRPQRVPDEHGRSVGDPGHEVSQPAAVGVTCPSRALLVAEAGLARQVDRVDAVGRGQHPDQVEPGGGAEVGACEQHEGATTAGRDEVGRTEGAAPMLAGVFHVPAVQRVHCEGTDGVAASGGSVDAHDVQHMSDRWPDCGRGGHAGAAIRCDRHRRHGLASEAGDVRNEVVDLGLDHPARTLPGASRGPHGVGHQDGAAAARRLRRCRPARPSPMPTGSVAAPSRRRTAWPRCRPGLEPGSGRSDERAIVRAFRPAGGSPGSSARTARAGSRPIRTQRRRRPASRRRSVARSRPRPAAGR